MFCVGFQKYNVINYVEVSQWRLCWYSIEQCIIIVSSYVSSIDVIYLISPWSNHSAALHIYYRWNQRSALRNLPFFFHPHHIMPSFIHGEVQHSNFIRPIKANNAFLYRKGALIYTKVVAKTQETSFCLYTHIPRVHETPSRCIGRFVKADLFPWQHNILLIASVEWNVTSSGVRGGRPPVILFSKPISIKSCNSRESKCIYIYAKADEQREWKGVERDDGSEFDVARPNGVWGIKTSD